MSSYTINVSKNGRFLFRTEMQPGSLQDQHVRNVIDEIANSFPASKGYEVQLAEYPVHLGKLTDITIREVEPSEAVIE